MTLSIRRAFPGDARKFASHMARHFAERGVDGVIMHPWPLDKVWDEEEMAKNVRERWEKDPLEPRGEAAWLLWSGENVYGHVTLQCGRIPSERHRLRLSLGVETPFRGMGHGFALMKQALDWARREEQFHWIDLSVFSGNAAARALYRKCGFTETYTVVDQFRVDGEQIDDVQMVLKLRDQPRNG